MRVLRDSLVSGMILERGAVGRDGRLLIAADTELTDRLLRILETAQVPIVFVTDASYEEKRVDPDLPPLTRKQERKIADRFRQVDLKGEFAQAVFQECLEHERMRIAESQKAPK